MKAARWLSLLLLLGSIGSCIWIGISLGVHTFAPTALPGYARLRTSELIFGGLTCMFVPMLMAIASVSIWWVFVRTPQHAAPTAAAPALVTAQRPLPAGPIPAMSNVPPALILDDYLTKMSHLLMAHQPPSRPRSTDVLNMVQAETRQALHALDASQRGRVVQFLYRAGFLSGESRVALDQLELRGIDLRFADLRNANLGGANLQRANLVGALLDGANLSKANLDEADLRLAQLEHATLHHATLCHAKLHRAVLRGAQLENAVLRGANLWQVDLMNARVTEAQLHASQTLSGTVMPNGSTYPEERS